MRSNKDVHFQRKSDCSLIPIFRQPSVTGVPPSAWRKGKVIYSSVNRFFIVSFWGSGQEKFSRKDNPGSV
jgi:hypothetical protein